MTAIVGRVRLSGLICRFRGHVRMKRDYISYCDRCLQMLAAID